MGVVSLSHARREINKIIIRLVIGYKSTSRWWTHIWNTKRHIHDIYTTCIQTTDSILRLADPIVIHIAKMLSAKCFFLCVFGAYVKGACLYYCLWYTVELWLIWVQSTWTSSQSFCLSAFANNGCRLLAWLTNLPWTTFPSPMLKNQNLPQSVF